VVWLRYCARLIQIPAIRVPSSATADLQSILDKVFRSVDPERCDLLVRGLLELQVTLSRISPAPVSSAELERQAKLQAEAKAKAAAKTKAKELDVFMEPFSSLCDSQSRFTDNYPVTSRSL
jgi:hypothetical protein